VKHKNFVPVNELTYGNTIEPVPFIPVSGNGVHYNPYQSRRKTFVSLGRGEKGEEEARKVQWNWLLKILESHNWAVPDAIDTPAGRPAFGYESQPSLAVGWYHPTFGHTWTQIRFPHSGEGEGFVNFSSSELLFILAARAKVKFPKHWNAVGVKRTIDPELIAKFKKNPWRTGLALFVNDWDRLGGDPVDVDRVLDILNPPDMSKAFYAPDITPTEEPWARQTGHGDLHQSPELVKQAAFKGMKILERALAAFKHLGVSMTVSTNMTVDGEHILEGLFIKIPGDKNDGHNRLGHTIHINGRGASIECGYVKDDEKHRAFQMREARKFLEQVQEYEDMAFKISRPDESS
jgi:hypothetical protein